jgi:hypothetical protein
MNLINSIAYGLIIFWALYSIIYINKVPKNEPYNPYFLQSIPNIFTTLGVLGTFLGIVWGLWKFDVNDIDSSIPRLLEGLKTAFFTSILGIGFNLVTGKFIEKYTYQAEKEAEKIEINDELQALQELNNSLIALKKEIQNGLLTLEEALIGQTDKSLATRITALQNELNAQAQKQEQALEKIQKAINGQEPSSLRSQIQNLQTDQNQNAQTLTDSLANILTALEKGGQAMEEKLNQFLDLLAKSNTEALVEVMKQATEQFNAQMSELIDRLVKENFQELNQSVQTMNTWQRENKEMISLLTRQFEQVAQDFQISAEAIKDITAQTQTLIGNNSHLKALIIELQNVMINDTKFQDTIETLYQVIQLVKTNTEAFDKTTQKLNDWVRNQMNFSDSVAHLLSRLEQIEKIKDINEIFWQNTKKQLTEGVTMIAQANKALASDLEKIDSQFYERLNNTLQNLDSLILSIIQKHKR